MASKIIVVIAAVVVVAAGVGGAYYFLKDNGDNKEPDADYTLLSSMDNLKEGLTFSVVNTSDDYESTIKYRVDSVDDTRMYITGTGDGHGNLDAVSGMSYPKTLDWFMPGTHIFDYTDETKVNAASFFYDLSVKHDGTKYTLNGTYPVDDDEDYEFDDFVIVYDSGSVKSVSGKMTDHMHYKNSSAISFATDEYDICFDLETIDGALRGDLTFKLSQRQSVLLSAATSYDKLLGELHFDQAKIAGITTAEEKGTLGNVEVTVYTLNGTLDGKTYENCKMFVYNGYMLKSEGKIDGKDNSRTISVYMS